MKRILSTFIVCLLTAVTFAQTSGKITYDMSFESDNPDMAMATSMLQGSNMVLSFMPKKSRVTVNMGMLGTVTTISDMKKKKVLMLMEMMGNKIASEDEINSKEIDSLQGKQEVKLAEETKDILGYLCKKAIITTADGNEIVFWYTEELKADITGQKQFNAKIPGVVLEFSTIQNEMTVNFIATKVEKKVDKADFSMEIPDGYILKTPEELKMMGQ